MGQSVKEREAEEDPNEGLMSSSSDDTKSKGCWGRWWERFYHQELKGWKPRPTARASIVTFAVMAAVMLGLGVVFLWMALSQVQVHRRYDDQGAFGLMSNSQRSELLRQNGSVITKVKVYIDEDMKAPVYMYYKLDDFFQNHKKYVKSINYDQLHGKNVKKSSLGDCDTKKTVDQSKLNDTEKANVTNNGIINPCGLGPWSFFNDSFSDLSVTSKGQASPGETVEVDSSDLVWDSDRDELYGNYASENFNDFLGLRGGSDLEVNVSKSEHFMAWLKFSSEPDAVKYWGKISRDLKKGESVSVVINNQFNTYDFDGKKWILLSTSGALGGRNPSFGVLWIGFGVLWTVATIVYTAVALQKGHLTRRTKAERIAWLESRLSWNRPKRSPLRDVLSRELSLPTDRVRNVQMAAAPAQAPPANGDMARAPSHSRPPPPPSAPQPEAPARHTVHAPAGFQGSVDHQSVHPVPTAPPPAPTMKVGQSTASLDSCRLPQPYLPGMQSPEQSFMRASSFGTNKMDADPGSESARVHGDGNPVGEAASAQTRLWPGSSGQQLSAEPPLLDGSTSSGIGRGTSLNGWIARNGR